MSVQDQAEIIDFRETESAVFADQEGEETVEDTIVEQEEEEIFAELDLEETIEDSHPSELEDIIEEVVGEIYDEDDEDDIQFSQDSITMQEDGTFIVRGDADLDDCDLILDLNLDEEVTLKEFGTLSGFLCMCAGEIPKVGDFVVTRGWTFEITDADPKRILSVKVERLVGYFDDENEFDEDKDRAVLGFLNRHNNRLTTKLISNF